MGSSVDQKVLKNTKFPPEFNQKVDMQKVNKEVMKNWIVTRITEILGVDDDIICDTCFNLLVENRYPKIKEFQIQVTAFLDKDSPNFCKELWALCLSAQSNPQGVPKELLEAKKLELIQEKIQKDKAAEADRARRKQEADSEKNADRIRQREREERRGRGYGRFDRGGRFPRRSRSRSPYNRRRNDRSPVRHRYSRSPQRRHDDFRAGNRDRRHDTYIPSQQRGRLRQDSRDRTRSSERSRSPINRIPPRKRQFSPSQSPPRRRPRRDPISQSPPPRKRNTSSPSSLTPRRDSASMSPSPIPKSKRRHRSSSYSRSPSPKPSRRFRERKRSRSPSYSKSPDRPYTYRSRADYHQRYPRTRHIRSRTRSHSPTSASSSGNPSSPDNPILKERGLHDTSTDDKTHVKKQQAHSSSGNAKERVGD